AVMADDGKIEERNINFNSTSSMDNLITEETTLKDYTARIIQHFLDKYDRNVVKVAKKLDIGKSTIYRMIKNDELTI
ncbi:MAG TPA: regulator, partial [Cryomorphaceae bacterium]|nr:regulator [Cryomorphaceae bacterium]